MTSSLRRARRAAAGLCTVLLVVLAALPAVARDHDEPPPATAYSGLVGVGAALGTLVYAPVKIAYAVTGTVISGFAWLWTAGDGDVTRTIFYSAVGGDYVILPSHVEGDRSLEFLGEAY